MTRYFHLFAKFVSFSFAKALHFRVDFLARIVLDVFTYTLNIFFFETLFNVTNVIGGWTRPQMLIFVSSFLVFDALRMTLFSNNTFSLPVLINKGGLDYYLIRPVSPIFILSLRDFSTNSFVSLCFAVSLLAWSISTSPESYSLLQIVLFVSLILVGVYLSHLLHLIFLISVFWTQGGRGLEGVYYNLHEYATRPHRIFSGWPKVLLLTVLPLSVMISLPSEFLFSQGDYRIWFYCVAIAVVFTFIFNRLWKMGLKAYSSPSS